MEFWLKEGRGRDLFVRYWRLIAEAVINHPSAFAAEFLNEHVNIRRNEMFETWRAASEAIISFIPNMSVSLCDVSEGAVLPKLFGEHFGGVNINYDTVKWIKQSNNLFYAWHWYGTPSSSETAVMNMLALGESRDVGAKGPPVGPSLQTKYPWGLVHIGGCYLAVM